MRNLSRFVAILFFSLVTGHKGQCVPAVIGYQGKLTGPGGVSHVTTVSLTFTFHDGEIGGSQLGAGFSDTDEVLPDSKGVCSTLVGDDPGNPIPPEVFAGDSGWLNVALNGENVLPRTRIGSVGYAFTAVQALRVPPEGDVDGAAVRSGTVAEPRIDPTITRDSELAAALEGVPAMDDVYTTAVADDRFIARNGSAYVVVRMTRDEIQNGRNLVAAYSQAKARTPHDRPLAPTNRAAVIVPPGRYDLQTTQILMDAEFVDLCGLSTLRQSQYIYGDGAADGVTTGVLRQTANDVHIENVRLHCLRTGSTLRTSADPAAYFPDGLTTYTQVRNCGFSGMDGSGSWSMRLGVGYAGNYVDCSGGEGSFGGQGTASGSFTNCVGDSESFGGLGNASGVFTHCTGGIRSFGGGAFGRASGRFIHCAGGMFSFGGDLYAVASGTFDDCAGGSDSFGGEMGAASGTFANCTGGNNAFGGSPMSTVSGLFTHCIGGASSFGGGAGVPATGARFHYCSGGPSSFPTSGGPILRYCLRDGAVYP